MFPFTLALALLGGSGLVSSLILCWLIFQRHSGPTHYQRTLRTLQLKRLSTVSGLFCLAMTASYALLHNPWALVYLLIACKLGSWWLRLTIIQRA